MIGSVWKEFNSARLHALEVANKVYVVMIT
jgi:hypothetical protein